MQSNSPNPSTRRLAIAAALLPLACLSTSSNENGPAAVTVAEPVREVEVPEGADQIVLARVDGVAITLEDAMSSFLSTHTGHGMLVKDEASVREIVGRLIERRLLLNEAASLGLTTDPEIEEGAEEYRLGLAEIRFWKREVDDKVHVTDEEVQAFYDKTDVLLQLTMLECSDREAAAAYRERVAAGEDFGELAAQFSIHPSKSFGGIVDFVTRGSMEASVDEAAFALENEQDLSPVVPTSSGFAFVRLEKRVVNEDRATPDVALPQIRGVLENRAKDELRTAIEERLAEQAGVEVHPEFATRAVLLGSEDASIEVARADGRSLTLGDMREFFHLEKLAAAPEEDADEAIALYVEKWTSSLATRREAIRSGLTVEPEIERQVAALRQRAVLGKLLEEYIWSDIEFGEEDLRGYYERMLDTEFTRPAEVRLAYSTLGTEAEAQAFLDRVHGGEDFGKLVKELSLDRGTAVHGGRIGWIRPGRILQVIEDATFDAEIGSYVGPIETELGWFVVHVMDKRDSVVVPYELAKRTAAEQLVEELRAEERARWTETLKERSTIEIDPDGIAAAVEWFERAAPSQPEQVESAGPPMARPEGPEHEWVTAQ